MVHRKAVFSLFIMLKLNLAGLVDTGQVNNVSRGLNWWLRWPKVSTEIQIHFTQLNEKYKGNTNTKTPMKCQIFISHPDLMINENTFRKY